MVPKLFILIVITLVLAGCNGKTSAIKEVCDEQALSRSIEQYPESKYPDYNQRAALQKQYSDQAYKDCLNLRGIEE